MENQDLSNRQNEIIKQWGAKVTRDIRSTVGAMFPGSRPKSGVIRNMNDLAEQNQNSFVRKEGPAKKTSKRFVDKNNSPVRISLKNSIRDKYFTHGTDAIDVLTITFARHGIFVLKGVGPGKRTPKDFINPIIDREFLGLADKIGALNADELLEVMIKKIK
jgi:hypothetical protein